MAPKVVRDTVLSLVREGFLQQVMGPALLQVHVHVYIPCVGTHIVWAVVRLHVNVVFITLCKLYVYAMQSLDLCCGASVFCSLIPRLPNLFNV